MIDTFVYTLCIFINYVSHVSRYGILTLDEVAKIMQVSQKTVYRWVSAKKLRAAKFGHKTYRVLEKDLMRFIKKHMQ